MNRFESRLAAFLVLATLAPSSGQENCGFYKFKIGQLEAAIVSDGTLPFTIAQFTATVPEEVLDPLLEDAFLPTDREAVLQIPQNVLYLESGRHRCLFDSGSAGFSDVFGSDVGRLLGNLAGMGVMPEDINCLIVSHGHADHFGGAQHFPNAEIYFNRREYNFWTGSRASFFEAQIAQDEELAQQLVELQQAYLSNLTNKISFYEYYKEIVPGVVPIPTPGHSIHHSSFEIRSSNIKATFVADSVTFDPLFVRNPGLVSGFDNIPLVAIDTRKEILESIAKEKSLLLSYHDQFPGIFYVRDDSSRRKPKYSLVPVIWSQTPAQPVGP